MEGCRLTRDELVTYLVSGCAFGHVENVLLRWVSINPRFKDFMEKYREKIRKKIESAKDEDSLNDVIFELQVAFLMLFDADYSVEYEKYGLDERAPDYYCRASFGPEFNLEVKRVRIGASDKRWGQCMGSIEGQVKRHPSNICFRLDILSADADEQLLRRMEAGISGIVEDIISKIDMAKDRMPTGKTCCFPVSGFEDVLELSLYRPLAADNREHTTSYGHSSPLFFTQKEYRKFGDSVFEKVGQMIPGMVNIIVITTDSATHDRLDLEDAMSSIEHLIEEEDDCYFQKKGFNDADDFRQRLSNVSGVLLISPWEAIDTPEKRNLLWINQNALMPIPEEVKSYLENMKVINDRH